MSAKCVYHKCDKRSADISLFRFPINDPDRLELWICNSGNSYLDSLTNDELRRRFICAAHFLPSSIHTGQTRNRLIGPAVPVHYKGTSTNTNTNEQDPLIKITEQCRFCGEYSTEWMDISYIPFLHNTEFSIVFNDINIRLDLEDDSLPKTVCINCNNKLQTVRDFVRLVKEAQDGFKIVTEENNTNDAVTNKSVRIGDNDKGIRDTFEDETVRRIDDDDEETRYAFEDKSPIKVECQSQTDDIHADISDIEYEIKTEYESDDNKESLDLVTVEETVILTNNKRKCVDKTIPKKAKVAVNSVNVFKFNTEVKEEAVEIDYTNEDSLQVSQLNTSGTDVTRELKSDHIAFEGATVSLIQGNKRKKETENRLLNEKESDIKLLDTSDRLIVNTLDARTKNLKVSCYGVCCKSYLFNSGKTNKNKYNKTY